MRGPLSWTYGATVEAAGRRDLRLDLLRGFCVVVMIVDHIGGDGSLLYALTGGNRFFVSAAEGFVLISGITMGTVYVQVLARDGIRGMVARVLRRVRFLYALTVSLTVAFAALSATLGSPWTREASAAQPLEFVLGVLTLQRSYSLTDVLLLYTLLVLAAVPVLALMARGHTAVALAGSWTLWAVWQVQPGMHLPWEIVDGGFLFPAWQALFTSGVAIGYHRRAIAARVAGMRRVIVAGAALASGTLIVMYATGLAVPPSLHGDGNLGALGHPLFDKDELRVGRVVALAAVATAAYGLVTLAWIPLRRATGWLLLPLGQHALGAYGLHIFVVAAAATPLADPLRAGGEHALAQLAAVALVWGAIPLAAHVGTFRRRLAALRVEPLLRLASPTR